MLDKIKVYRRSDTQEEKAFHLGFKVNGIALDFHKGEVFNLTKTDPLNKFKNEMEGWWFGKEYVVICQNDVLFNATYHAEKEKFGYIEFRKNIDVNNPLSIFGAFTQGKKSVIQDIDEYNGWSNFFGRELPTVKDLPITYSLLGEEKYIKFLELIK